MKSMQSPRSRSDADLQPVNHVAQWDGVPAVSRRWRSSRLCAAVVTDRCA